MCQVEDEISEQEIRSEMTHGDRNREDAIAFINRLRAHNKTSRIEDEEKGCFDHSDGRKIDWDSEGPTD